MQTSKLLKSKNDNVLDFSIDVSDKKIHKFSPKISGDSMFFTVGSSAYYSLLMSLIDVVNFFQKQWEILKIFPAWAYYHATVNCLRTHAQISNCQILNK